MKHPRILKLLGISTRSVAISGKNGGDGTTACPHSHCIIIGAGYTSTHDYHLKIGLDPHNYLETTMTPEEAEVVHAVIRRAIHQGTWQKQ